MRQQAGGIGEGRMERDIWLGEGIFDLDKFLGLGESVSSAILYN